MKIGVKAALRASLVLLLVMTLTGSFAAQQAAPASGPDAASLVRHLHWRSIGPANMVGRISDFEALDSDFTQVLVGFGLGRRLQVRERRHDLGADLRPATARPRSATSPSSRRTRTSSGSARARNASATASPGATASTSRPTAARPSPGWAWRRRRRSPASSPTRPIPNIVYVAASGHPWGYTGDRGLFKTTDGGKTWTKLAGGLPNDGKTGAIDLVMDPTDPETLYVAFWQRLRQPWRFDSGGPNGGIFKTTDGGKTWTKLTQGLPAGELGRIGLAISRSNPQGPHGHRRARLPAPADGRPGERREAQSRLRRHDQARHGHLPVRGRRRDLEVHEPDEQPAVLLQPHLHQSARGQVGLLPGHEHELLDRRRQDLEPGRRPASRLPRHVDRSDEQEPLLRRPGRRRLPHLRSRQAPGSSSTTSASPSSTPSAPTCAIRTTSTAACRTTAPGAARR